MLVNSDYVNIVDDARMTVLKENYDLSGVQVEVVWDPPWDQSRLTPRGAAALSTWGIV